MRAASFLQAGYETSGVVQTDPQDWGKAGAKECLVFRSPKPTIPLPAQSGLLDGQMIQAKWCFGLLEVHSGENPSGPPERSHPAPDSSHSHRSSGLHLAED